MSLTLSNVENTMRAVFDDKLVKSVATVYEKKTDYDLLIFSIHGLELEDSLVIHTKIIFKTDKEHTQLIDNSFNYLINLGCGYRNVTFEEDNKTDLAKKLTDIILSNDFDEELIDISRFISEAPDTKINEYLAKKNIEEFSCLNTQYMPKLKIQPCSDTNYDFDIELTNDMKVDVSISRENHNTKESTFILIFKSKNIHKVEVDNLKSLPQVIAQNLIEIIISSKD